MSSRGLLSTWHPDIRTTIVDTPGRYPQHSLPKIAQSFVHIQAEPTMNIPTFARALCGIILALTTTAVSHPTTSDSPKVIHERRDDALHNFWTKIGRAAADTPLALRIGLNQQNLDRAEEFITSVAHPRSETYGQHWTPQQVIEMFAPSEDALTVTEDWLRSEGIDAGRMSRAAGRHWIRVASTVSEAEKLLDAVYNVYENKDGSRLVACESYSVPAAIQGHIDLIAPTIQFVESDAVVVRGPEKRATGSETAGNAAPLTKRVDPESLENCSEAITPACLRAM